MKFHKVTIPDHTREKGALAEYWSSEFRSYKVHKSLNGDHWLAFFKSSNSEYSLVGPPVSSREEAQEQCLEHSTDLPW